MDPTQPIKNWKISTQPHPNHGSTRPMDNSDPYRRQTEYRRRPILSLFILSTRLTQQLHGYSGLPQTPNKASVKVVRTITIQIRSQLCYKIFRGPFLNAFSIVATQELTIQKDAEILWNTLRISERPRRAEKVKKHLQHRNSLPTTRIPLLLHPQTFSRPTFRPFKCTRIGLLWLVVTTCRHMYIDCVWQMAMCC